MNVLFFCFFCLLPALFLLMLSTCNLNMQEIEKKSEKSANKRGVICDLSNSHNLPTDHFFDRCHRSATVVVECCW